MKIEGIFNEINKMNMPEAFIEVRDVNNGDISYIQMYGKRTIYTSKNKEFGIAHTSCIDAFLEAFKGNENTDLYVQIKEGDNKWHYDHFKEIIGSGRKNDDTIILFYDEPKNVKMEYYYKPYIAWKKAMIPNEPMDYDGLIDEEEERVTEMQRIINIGIPYLFETDIK